MHHVTPELLAWAFHQLKARAAPGVDGVTWEEYKTRMIEFGRYAAQRRSARGLGKP